MAIVLRYYIDLSFAEVAQVLAITPKAARSRTYRALERLAATITSARPQACGAAQGPSGPVFFESAMYFQTDGAWYYLSFTTDTPIGYRGPGTYTARAVLDFVGPDGPGQTLYEGSVQLTVTADNRPYAGRVSGTLDWSGAAPPPNHQATVSGSWTCMPGDQLGPA